MQSLPVRLAAKGHAVLLPERGLRRLGVDFGCNEDRFLRFLCGHRPLASGVGIDHARQSIEIA